MASEVDQRIVEMRFDNKDFEKNVAQTMETLDKFDQKLDFSQYADTFKKIEKASGDVKLSKMQESAEAVSVKFSVMQTVALTAISRITNAAIDMGTNLVKSLSIDQVNAGWDKYAEKTSAIQTIMAATANQFSDQAEQMKYVNEQIDKLNWFTDETSYNLLDMVSNIGKFTSQGIKLDDAVTAMQGIANWAAISGANSVEASRAMYNLSQALGKGYVQLIDWKSIENANMATVQFKETVLETAVAEKKLKKVGDGLYETNKGNTVSVSDFNSAMKDAWFTSDVLMKSLDKYGGFTNKLNEAYEAFGHTLATSEILGYLEKYQKDMGVLADVSEKTGIAIDDLRPIFDEMSDASFNLGQRAFRAAQEAKTFAEAIQATKDAVSTGWMNTFELIFGDYTEAKRIWTALANEMWEIFAGGAERRNDILREWVSIGGRSILFGDGTEENVGAIAEAWAGLKSILEAVKKAFKEVFPSATAQSLKKLSENVAVFAKKLQLSDEALYSIKVTAKLLITPLKMLFDVVGLGVKAFGLFALVVLDVVDSFLKMLATENPLEKWLGEDRYSRVTAALTTIVTRLGNALGRLFDSITGANGGTSLLDKMIDVFVALGKVLEPLAEWILDKIVDALEKIATADFSNIKNFFGWIKSGFESFAKFLGTSGDELAYFSEAFKGKSIIAMLDTMISRLTGIRTIAGTLNTTFISGLTDVTNDAVSGIRNISNSFLDLVKSVTPAKVLLFGFGAALVSLTASLGRATSYFADFIWSAKKTLDAIKGRLRVTIFERIGRMLIILAGALLVIASIPSQNLIQASVAIGVLMTALTAMTGVFALIQKFISGDDPLLAEKKIAGFNMLAKSLVTLSLAVLTLSAALKLLSSVDLEGIWPRIGVLAVVMAGLVAVSAYMAKHAPDLSKGAFFMVAYAISVATLIDALSSLATADFSNVTQHIGALTVIIGALAGIAVLAKNLTFGAGSGLALLIADLFLMIAAIKLIQKIPVNSLTKNLGSFVVLLGMIAAVGVAARIAGKSTSKVGLGLITMAAAMLILVDSIERIAKIDRAGVENGVAAVVAILSVFGLIAQATKLDQGQTAAKISGFIGIAAAVMVLSIAIKYLGTLSETEVTQGTKVVLAILVLFGLILAVGLRAEASAGAIAAIAVTIGMLTASLMLLTLPASEEGGFEAIMTGVVAIGAILLALAALMKRLQSFKLTTSVGLIGVIGVTLVGITGALMKLQAFPAKDTLNVALALSAILLSIGMSSKMLTSFNWKAGVAGAVMVGVLLAELIAAFWAIDKLDINMAEVTPAMAEIRETIGAVALVAAVLSLANVNLAKAAAGAAAIDAVILIIGGLLVGVGYLETKYGISKFISSSRVVFEAFHVLDDYIFQLIALSAVMGLMGLFAGPIVTGAAAFDAVVAAIGAILIGASKLMEWLGDIDLDKGAVLLEKIGETIGRVIGAIAGGLFASFVDISSTGFVGMAENLEKFAIKMASFFDVISQIDPGSIDKVKTVVDTMSDVINTKNTFDSNKKGLDDLGKALERFAPSGASFAKTFQDANISDRALIATQIVCSSIKTLMDSLPKKGGLSDLVSGTADLGEFADGLVAFAPGISRFLTDISDLKLDEERVNNVVNLAKIVAGLYENLPRQGGVLQDLIGTQSLSKFATEMSAFAPHFINFYGQVKALGKIDDTNVKSVVNMAKMMAALANNLPSADGILQFLIGGKDIGAFGADLVTFAGRFREFWTRLEGIEVDDGDIKKIETICQMLQVLVEMIPEDKGLLGDIFGGGKDLSGFAQAMQDFSTGIESMSITARSYGTDIATAFKSGIRFERDKMVAAGKDMVTYVVNGIQENTPNAGQRAKWLGEEVIHAFNKEINGKFEESAKHSADGWIRGIEKNSLRVFATTGSFGAGILEAFNKSLEVNSPSKKFEKSARYCGEGFVVGLKKSAPRVNKAGENLGDGLIDAMRENLGIHSPAVRVQKEVAHWIVEAFVVEFDKDDTPAEKAAKMTEAVLKAISDTLSAYDLQSQIDEGAFSIWQTLFADESTKEGAATLKANQLANSMTAINNLVKKYDLMLTNYQKTVETYGEDSMEAMQAYKQIQDQMASIAQKGVDIAGMMNENVTAIWTDQEYATNYANAVWEVTHHMAELEEQAKKTGVSVDDFLSNMYKMTREEYLTWNYKKLGFDENMKQIITQEAVEANSIVNEAMAEVLGDRYASLAEATVDGVQNWIDANLEAALSLDSSAVKFQMKESGTSGGKTYVDGVAAGIDNPESQGKVQNAITKLLSPLNASEDEKEYGDGPMGKIDRWLDGRMEKWGDRIAGASNMVDQMIGVGEDADAGVAQGIESSDASAKAAEKQAEKATAAAKSGFKEHSPSRSWFEIGYYAILGLLNGLRSGSGELDASGMEVALTLFDSLNEQSGKESKDFLSEFSNSLTPNSAALAEITNAGEIVGNSFVDGVERAIRSREGELWKLLQAMLKAQPKESSVPSGGIVPVYSSGGASTKTLDVSKAWRVTPETVPTLAKKSAQMAGALAGSIASQLSKKNQNESDSQKTSTKIINQTLNQTINAPKVASAATIYRATNSALAQDDRRLKDLDL